MPHRPAARIVLSLLLTLLVIDMASAQVPHPSDTFGFTPGDDYKLATYEQMLTYYRQLAEASPRVVLREIGTTVLERPMLLLFISSEANLKELERWRGISEQLARARIDEETARQQAQEGKAIVWIDGGLHATEVAGAQMTPLLAYRVATEESAEMQHIRDHTILLLMPVMNPDGLDIVAAWYRRNLGTPFETTSPPWLYHHYIGHDNNRDWFMNNMPESQAVTQVLYNEWYPQIVYNHHQTGPSWTRIFLPPFADPVNPNIHPGVTTGVNLVGSAMANRFAHEEMPGAVSDVIYSMWWNGGMRTVPYFHNMIGILTETSHATPSPRYYDPDSIPSTVASRGGVGIPTSGTDIFYPYPWQGGESHFKDPVAYMLTASMAVLRIAADLREHWLYNIYRMGRHAIEKGETDTPYAYIIPPDQWNAGEELNLANLLRLGGIEIHRATAAFRAGDHDYPAGSFVIYTAQAFRPYLIDLLEKQTYPNQRSSPDGPPDPPYDLAGWTLPIQMGVRVDRAETTFEATTAAVTEVLTPAPGAVHGEGRYGYLFSHRPNTSILAANRLLREGERVHWAGQAIDAAGQAFDAGTFIVTARNARSRRRVEALARELGVDFYGIDTEPDGPRHTLALPRIGLYKSWVSNMDEGWTRWLLETYAFAVDTLHDADIRTADLTRYHAIVLPDQSASRILGGHTPGTMPDEYVGGLGLEGAVALKRYVTQGGMLVALDAASDFVIDQFGLPVENSVAGASSRSFFIPGSLVRMTVATEHPLAFGMEPETAAYFVNSRVFETVRLPQKREGGREEVPAAPSPPIDFVTRYAEDDILMSGWALGEKSHLGGKAAMLRIQVGDGDVVLFGFPPQFRGQPRGTYKLFFNALHAATLDAMPALAGSPNGMPAEEE